MHCVRIVTRSFAKHRLKDTCRQWLGAQVVRKSSDSIISGTQPGADVASSINPCACDVEHEISQTVDDGKLALPILGISSVLCAQQLLLHRIPQRNPCSRECCMYFQPSIEPCTCLLSLPSALAVSANILACKLQAFLVPHLESMLPAAANAYRTGLRHGHICGACQSLRPLPQPHVLL